MKFQIHTSIDISNDEENYLRSYFKEETFEIDKSIFTPGADGTFLILNFVIGSVAGGVLYDLVKEGIKKIFEENKSKPGREITITIKHNEKFFRLMGEKVSTLDSDGIYIDLESIDKVFEKNEKIKS